MPRRRVAARARPSGAPLRSSSVPDLSSIIKAYDVRGVVPDQWDEDVARAIGAAFAEFVHAESGATAVVTAHDMRESSVPLSRAFAEGVISRGVDVVEAGLGSTDMLYFAAGSLDLPGAMFTASHNPAQYNGIKMCRAGAAPIGQDSGLATIRESAERDSYDRDARPRVGLGRHAATSSPSTPPTCARWSTCPAIRPLKVVVDAGNGMGGHTVPVVLAGLPLEIVPLYFELDGSFPNHEANPLDPANLVDLQAAVREHGADIGLAFDGDADRVLRRRRARRAGQPLGGHRPGRRPRAGQGPRDDDHPQPDHLAGRARDRPRARRRAGAHPGGALVHQGRDGPHRRRLRRRALRALLLPRLLAGRHRHARRDARARRAGRAVRPAVRADRRLQPLRRLRGDQLHGGRRRRPRMADVREAFAEQDGVTVDELDGLTVAAARRRVVQPARQQHRAAAAAQRRGARRGADGRRPRPGTGDGARMTDDHECRDRAAGAGPRSCWPSWPARTPTTAR